MRAARHKHTRTIFCVYKYEKFLCSLLLLCKFIHVLCLRKRRKIYMHKHKHPRAIRYEKKKYLFSKFKLLGSLFGVGHLPLVILFKVYVV